MSDEKRQAVIDVLESKFIVDDDREVMRKAGERSGLLITDGQSIEREDCIVAATGLLHVEAVVTGNVDRFERVDGLDVRTYRA